MFTPEKIPCKGKVIDITVPISPFTPIFPGDPKPSIESACTLEKDGCAVSRLLFGSHTGTHVDAPSHVLKGGLTADNLDLESLMGRAVVLDFTQRIGALTASILEMAYNDLKIIENIPVLLLKTRNSFRNEKDTQVSDFQEGRSANGRGPEKFPEESAYLDACSAAWIVRKGFKTIGIDSFSVDSISSESLPAHHALLSNDVNIVECLDLSSVNAGVYFFLCMPLKIEGCDGAPARALLISYS
jgi:arylformamidase